MSFYIAWGEGVIIVAFIVTRIACEIYEQRRFAYRKRVFETEGRYVP